MPKIYVLRLGHRRNRDKRTTTHVGLVARALGCDGIILSGEKDNAIINSLRKVVENWGGPFDIKYAENPLRIIKDWKEKGGIVIHLTMYGINIPDIIDQIRKLYAESKDILVIVGAEKVPRMIYELADYNVAVSNQPHSEIAALGIFLDWLFEGKELTKAFQNARIKIIPHPKGKRIIEIKDQEN